MKTTSFSQHLGTYFDEYLPNVRNYSPKKRLHGRM